MICAVPPKAMARGMTTGSPAAGNRPALILLKRTVVSPKPINPKGAGFAVSAMVILPVVFVVWEKLRRISFPRHAIPGMTGATSSQFQLQDHGQDSGSRGAELADQFVDLNRGGAQGFF